MSLLVLVIDGFLNGSVCEHMDVIYSLISCQFYALWSHVAGAAVNTAFKEVLSAG